MLPLVNRVSAAGTAIVVALGLVLAAVVEQRAFPVGSSHRPVAAPGPARGSARPTSSSRSKHRRKPVSPAVLLNHQVQRVAVSERGPAARSEFGVRKVASPVVRLTRLDKRRMWAFGTEAIPPPRGSSAMPEASVFVARASGSTWKVALAGGPEFAALLRKAPVSVLPADERSALLRYDASVEHASDGLMLPWTAGQSWTLVPTERGLSFGGGDGRVLAATSGRLYRLCSPTPDRGLVLVVGADGTAVEYYQLDQLTEVPDGGLVERGDYLGRTSADQPCGGGAALGPLVRFGLRNADGPIAFDGLRIGGWTLHDVPGAPFAEHDGLRVGPGNPLLNFGITATPSPSPSKSGGRSPDVPPLLGPSGSPSGSLDDQT
jgi:hypothetical protein